MFVFLKAITLTGLVVFLASPFLVARSKMTFLPGVAVSILAACVLCVWLAWWNNTALDIELWWMGADMEKLTYQEATEGLTPERRERAEAIFVEQVSGVGWPLHAIFGFFLAVPYAGLVFSVMRWIRRIRSA